MLIWDGGDTFAAMPPDTMAAPVTAPLLVRNEDELLAAIRARLIELNITYDCLDCVALLPNGTRASCSADPQ